MPRGLRQLLSVLVLSTAACWLGLEPAQAITMDEIPPELKDRLPAPIWKNIESLDPRALDYITIADIEEIAEAYETGTLRFVDQVEIMESGGALTPELARLALQIPTQAPYIPERFVRNARHMYGIGVFSTLRWAVTENEDNSVNIQLWYKSNNPVSLLPEVTYSGFARLLFGMHYRDLYHGMKDKQIEVSIGSSGREPDEVTGFASYADNTLNGGANSVSANVAVENQWRTRLGGTPQWSRFRDRVSSANVSYSFNRGVGRLDGANSRITLGAGVYDQDEFVYEGDPTAGGTLPRSGVLQTGTGAYIRTTWSNAKRDSSLVPRDGWSYSVSAEQHVGDWDMRRYRADLRRYLPLRSPLGIAIPPVGEGGCVNDAELLFAPASLAIQVQADVEDGDVPYSREVVLGGMETVRGYSYDDYPGTHFIGVREEYRFALTDDRKYEMFLFNDNGWVGESFGSMRALNSVGAGVLGRLPLFGLKGGAYYARGISDDTSNLGIALAYAF